MKKVIMIPEDRYSRMIDSYDQAVEELARVREQLEDMEAGSKIVELLQRGELVQNRSLLEDMLANYTDNRDDLEGIEAASETPEPIRALMNWMDSHIGEFPEELGNSVIEALGEYEQQWFINGFRYAIGIVQAC